MTAGNSQILRTVSFILIVVLLCPFAYGRIIYVDDDATGGNIGSSWLDAINSLQDALLLSYFYEKPVEIRVAKGIYTPDKGIGIMPGDREASFELINSVTIKGGYAGLSDRPADSRDVLLYETILSGDLGHNDGSNPENISENSFRVVTSNRTDQNAVLDGVTITAGGGIYRLGRDETRGGGIYNDSGSPMLINCTFRGNRGNSGAGMYNESGKPNLLNCTFTENTADGEGGAIYNLDGDPVLTNCTFNKNSASNGGGIYSYRGTTMLADCHFIGNSTEQSGGAVYNYGGILTFLNCIFKENSAVGDGGAIFNDSNFSSQANLTNCIFSGNSARNGGAIGNGRSIPSRALSSINTTDYNPSALFLLNCTLSANSAHQGGGGISSDIRELHILDERTGLDNRTTLINCILWGNTPNEIQEYMSESVVVLYSNVQGGFPGQGNIDVDPLFADPDSEDYHLRSQAGRWNPFSQNWVIDQESSLCIDAGDPTTPVGLERFPNGDRINMGAYGGTPEASLSPQQQLPLPGQATNPNPPDGAVYVDWDIILSWTPGSDAVLHNVYFGTDYDDVKQSNIDDTRDVLVSQNQRVAIFDPGLLDFGQTYYWRVDEINSEGNIIFGDVWMFTVTSLGPPKGRACFTFETEVWSDGKLVPISRIASGRSINVIDCIKTVEKVQEHNGTFTLYDILLESGEGVTVAENHYFMTESEQWVSLQNLMTDKMLPCVRTRLKTSKGSVGITSITKRPMPYIGRVYNLKIKGSDRYLIGKDAIIVRDY